MSTAMEPTYVNGWQETKTPDGYRVVGCQHSGWFALGPLNSVIAYPPAHLTIWGAMDWMRKEVDGLTQQEARKNDG